jgi:hypothetical protein
MCSWSSSARQGLDALGEREVAALDISDRDAPQRCTSGRVVGDTMFLRETRSSRAE